MQCLILVGGLGTRMSDICRDIPKALLPVGSRTFLEWQLEWLALCGVTEAVLAVGHQGELIQEHLARSPQRGNFPKLKYSFDGDALLGTGGAIANAAPLLNDDFLVTYGDSFLFLNVRALFREHLGGKHAVTFSIYQNENHFDVSNVEYTNGRLSLYDKKQRTSAMHHIDYGMFALNKMKFLENTPEGSFDVADYLRDRSLSGEMAPFLVDQRFYEVGSPNGYESFCALLDSVDHSLDACQRMIGKLQAKDARSDNLSFLLIIPGSVSYFYDVEGFRIARSLERLGIKTEVCSLSQLPTRRDYDWVVFFNLTEIQLAFGKGEDEFLEAIEERRLRANRSALLLMESLRMTWFYENFALFKKCQLETLLDLGFLDQQRFFEQETDSDSHSKYHFLLNSLSEHEKSVARSRFTSEEERPLPWSFIGHRTLDRIRFAAELMQRLSPQGFLYLPEFTPITKNGPHLNESKFEQVLQKSRLSIWCSHVPHFYLESLRFRYALLNGAVPAKVNHHAKDSGDHPFSYLVFETGSFPEALREINFETTRDRFATEFLELPSFEEILSRSPLLGNNFGVGATSPGGHWQ